MMSVRRRLPPIEQIEAFIQAARSPNFRAAAEKLALSPAALSRRIQAFSSYVGHDLFERCAGGVRLTEAGKECLEELEPSFLLLRRAAATVSKGAKESAEVKLSLSHSLAVGWLIPRLSGFRADHPDIDLSLKIERTAADIRRGDVDIGICHSGVDLSNLHVQHLMGVTMTPMASPELACAYKAGQIGLDHQPLFVSAQTADAWSKWVFSTGFEANLVPSVEFDILHAMYEAAAHGLGFVLGASPTVCPHLDSGRLVPLGLATLHVTDGYHLATTPSRLRRSAVTTVWQWLRREARTTRDPFSNAQTKSLDRFAFATNPTPH